MLLLERFHSFWSSTDSGYTQKSSQYHVWRDAWVSNWWLNFDFGLKWVFKVSRPNVVWCFYVLDGRRSAAARLWDPAGCSFLIIAVDTLLIAGLLWLTSVTALCLRSADITRLSAFSHSPKLVWRVLWHVRWSEKRSLTPAVCHSSWLGLGKNSPFD